MKPARTVVAFMMAGCISLAFTSAPNARKIRIEYPNKGRTPAKKKSYTSKEGMDCKQLCKDRKKTCKARCFKSRKRRARHSKKKDDKREFRLQQGCLKRCSQQVPRCHKRCKAINKKAKQVNEKQKKKGCRNGGPCIVR